MRSRILLDEDMDLIFENCEVLPVNNSSTNISWCEKCKNASILCLWGASVYKFRLLGLCVTAPLTAFFIKSLYREYKEKRYKNYIERLVESSLNLHKINNDIVKYLKTRELFNKVYSPDEHIKNIFHSEIALIDHLMSIISSLSDFSKSIQPESWRVQDLRLNEFNNQEECFENFAKLHDISVLIISKLLASIAVTISSNPRPILDRVVPECLKILQIHVNTIENQFKSARSLRTTKKSFENVEIIKPKPTLKLEQCISKLLTHLQLTFEIAQQIHNRLLTEKQLELEGFSEDVFDLQQQLTFCEQNLDQFCGIYGILIKKKMVVKEKVEIKEEAEEKIVKTACIDGRKEEEIVEGDEEYELYVGESDGDENDEEKNCDNYEEEESAACLLLVLQELKDRLKERQIIRAKKLGLPMPQQSDDDVPILATKETKLTPPIPFSVTSSAERPEFTEIGTSSFANAIKLMAQQRHCEEDVFEATDDENENE